MKKKTIAYLVAAAVGTGLLLAWAFAPRALEVEVAVASQGLFERSIEDDGKTRLRERYLVSAPLSGRLARITLHEGDAVCTGDVLATLTPAFSPMLDERTVRELNARIDTVQATVQRAATRIQRAQVSVAQARAELGRSEQLAEQGFIAPIKLETDRLNLEAAQREYDMAVLDQRVATHELNQARAALVAVREPDTGANRAFAVRAPVDGRVLKIMQASESVVSMGSPLLEVGDIDQMEVVAELLTTEALSTPPGTLVRIHRWGRPGALEGRVRRVEPAAFTKISALGVEEQRVRVLIDLLSPQADWRGLGDGYRVGVQLVVQRVDNALRVPVSAVFPWNDGERRGMALFVVQSGPTRMAQVEVGGRNAEEAWILSGIDAGTLVIVYPPPGVKDGGRVKVREP